MRTLEQIVDAVERAVGLPKNATLDPDRRTRDVSLARHVIFYLARKETKLSFVSIAAHFHFDHKSVMYGFNRVSCELAKGLPETVRILMKSGERVRLTADVTYYDGDQLYDR